ncbi:MAG TPA: YciI family protein [Bacteroidia bacterium]|jgi:uncharacterized protein YciI|nr:YciI family protein [Bacteroidia bacterium]
MKNLLLALLFLSTACFAQKTKSNFDSILAKKLGADDYGMKQYVFCLLKTGPAKNVPKTKQDSLFAGHMKNIGRLADEGKLALAGPFMNSKQEYRGLFIFNVTTIEEAEKLVQTDPAIKNGLLKAEFTEWYGSASLLQIPEMHKKLQKKSF